MLYPSTQSRLHFFYSSLESINKCLNVLYLNDIIKDTHEIIGIYSLNKCTNKETQYTLSIQLLHPSSLTSFGLVSL